MPASADYDGDGFISNGEAMRGAMEGILTASKAVGESLEKLDQEIHPTLQRWESEGPDGGAKGVYDKCQRDWDRAANELQAFLTKAGQGVGAVADIYRQQDLNAMRTLEG